MWPVPPPASAFDFSAALAAADPGQDLIAVGGDLAPATILGAYREGVFPMGVGRRGGPPVGWWSPDPRGVLPLDSLRVSRSLRASRRRFEIRVDTAFDAVVEGCADPARPGAWITPQIRMAYGLLHQQGWAHSVECWHEGRLVGGLYGIAMAGLFAGESMFHRQRDASKVALCALVDLLAAAGDDRRLLDVQWSTPHLQSLGVIAVDRREYLRRLSAALQCAPIHWPGHGGG